MLQLVPKPGDGGMQHLSIEEIRNYLQGRASDTERSAAEAHFQSCSECSESKQFLAELVLNLRLAEACEPPARVLEAALNVIPACPAPEKKPLREFIAELVSDTFELPRFAFGTRRVGLPPRHLLFRAGEIDVDIQIESQESTGRVSLMGQLLSESGSFFDHAPVRLESQGVVRFRTETNAVGEFSFDDLPKDTYNMSVDLPQGQITLFCVHRGEC
jgi:hypothetical protein